MNAKHSAVILSQAARGKSSMATAKKVKPAAIAPALKPATNKLNGKAISARATGTPEARETAKLLLEIEAIHCRPENPYIFTSGRASPVYIDCRKIISFPEARAKIIQHAYKTIEKTIGWSKIDVVAGGETAGIPFAAFLAALSKKSMVYVRKQPKGFGRMAQIEGDLKPGKRVLLVEDLATDGGSKLVFIDALKRAEAKVTDCFVVFHYGIFPQSVETLAVAGVKLHALATWWDALEAAQKGKYFDERGLAETSAFLEAPEQWSANHGGRPPAPRLTAR
jgi:orotate phosphoribosyltransferase